MKKLFALLVALMMLTACGAQACTMIYAGPANTADGATYYGRSEDYYNSRSKLFLVVEAGEISGTYKGCSAYGGGFTMELEKPGYSFTAFAEDNLDGICPECFEEADHYAYTEAGTNEMGVTVSGTETLYGTAAVLAVDPYRDGEDPSLPIGIEETDIPTVILSQAATAREGIELLMNIYDTYGCQDAAGLIVADQQEMWYIENCSGTQYIAIKMPADMIALEPNMAIIGLIDLDDTENVIASKDLIAIAKEAGTFVGNEEENQIDFRASYSGLNIDNRLVNGLNFINPAMNYTADMLAADNTLFTISNLNAEGEIAALYTNIKADRLLTIDDMVNYYKVSGIGRDRNADTSIFQIFAEGDMETSTIEWVAMNNCAYNVFIPFYPVLTSDTYAGYQYGTGSEGTSFVDEEPTEGMYYLGSTWAVNENGWYRKTGYVVYPEGWQNSYTWCFDALSNYLLYRDAGEEAAAKVLDAMKTEQAAIYDTFAAMQSKAAAETDLAALTDYMTETSNAMAADAHALALQLWNEIAK